MIIRTVLGDIPPSELGVTTCHEHLLWNVPEPYQEEDPDLGFDSIPAAVAELRYFSANGGSALVEMTTPEIGRCPAELKQISLASSVHVIAATGHHKHKFSSSLLVDKTESQIAEEMIKDICLGMDSTNIRAGVIKAATSENQAYDCEQKVIAAAGIAHRETGAPVSTHTESGTYALQQIELLKKAGIPPSKTLIGHLDRGLPFETYRAIAKTGVFMGFDQIGKEKYWPDAERVELIVQLIQFGHHNQILLSGDTARKSSWHTYNPVSGGIAHLLVKFLPRLRSAGIHEDVIHSILVDNPASFLAF